MSRPDIVLITIDSLRADSVGFLADDAPATPTIDSFAGRATLATAATAPSSHTRASVPAILTSQYAHRFFTDFLQDVDAPTVAQMLSEAGYETAAFHSNPLLSRHFGYDCGFDTFSDGLRFVENTRLPETATRLYSKAVRLLRRYPYEPAESITERAVEWLSSRDGDSPAFLWVHYMDPHGPYALDRERGYIDKFRSERLWRKAVTSPDEVTEEEVARLRDAYCGEIEYTDRHLAPLLEAIDAYTDEVCTVLTADHGEEFREHGTFSHHPKLYEEVTRVPFIAQLPGAERLSGGLVSPLDVVPTVLSGVERRPVSDEFVGIDITDGSIQRDYLVTETNPAGSDVMVGIRSENYKYIVHEETEELYDIGADPAERENLVGTDHAAEEELRSALTAHLDAHDISGGDKLAATATELDSEMQGRLEDLGYL